jgi:hypothetical protein
MEISSGDRRLLEANCNTILEMRLATRFVGSSSWCDSARLGHSVLVKPARST